MPNNGLERELGDINARLISIDKTLSTLAKDFKTLPCREHVQRLVRVEAKVDDLNNVKRTIRTSLMRWLIPYILIAAGAGYLVSVIHGG